MELSKAENEVIAELAQKIITSRTKRAEKALKEQKELEESCLLREKDPIIVCSFCGKNKEEVVKIITGPDGVAICNECVELCNEMFEKGGNHV